MHFTPELYQEFILHLNGQLKILCHTIMYDRLNTPDTRKHVSFAVGDYLLKILKKFGCLSMIVTCDETNNPPDIIKQNKLVLTWAIKMPDRTTLEFDIVV
jgi:hypothetical protein